AHEFGAIPTVAVLHEHHHRRAAGHHVHSAANAAADLFRRAPVGDVAGLVDLVGAQHDHVDFSGAHHFECGHAVVVGGARLLGDVIAARIVHVIVDGVFGDRAAVAQDSVLAVQGDIATSDVVRHQRGDTQAQIDVAVLGQQRGRALGHLGAGPGGFAVVGAWHVCGPAEPA